MSQAKKVVILPYDLSMTLPMQRMVLMIGSGLHKQVLQTQMSPLSSWTVLLDAVAEMAKIKIPNEISSPTIRWEAMVTAIVDQGRTSSIWRKRSKGISYPSQLNASQGEKKLREFACKIITDSACVVQCTYDRDPIVNLIRARIKQGGIDVIDFNFDWLLLGGKPKFKGSSKGKPTPESKKLRGRIGDQRLIRDFWQEGEDGSARIWKPHGHVGRPTSLRLGLRDYGFQPVLYQQAFAEYKGSQRLQKVKKASFSSRAIIKSLDTPKSWIEPFMDLPVRIVGLGISPEEIGLRWLFVQRKRNWATKKNNQSSSIKHFFNSKDPSIYGVNGCPSESWNIAWELAVR